MADYAIWCRIARDVERSHRLPEGSIPFSELDARMNDDRSMIDLIAARSAEPLAIYHRPPVSLGID